MRSFYFLAEREKRSLLQRKAGTSRPEAPKRSNRFMKKRERKAEERAAEERARKGPANMIPGFSIIKNSIITPLIMATEKVIEYTMPESKIQEIEREMEEAKQ